MASQLILMRHAKSSHDDPALADHDRPLAPRGQRDSPRMADWLAENELIPDMILSSTSRRTRQTAELMLTRWKETPIVSFSRSLYLAGPETMLATLRSDHCGHGRILMLGHNPGISQLASLLAEQSVSMPTAALAVFDLEPAESDPPEQDPADSVFERLNTSRRLRLTALVRPKSLKA